MKAIKRKNFVLAALTGLGILTGAMLLVFGGAMSEIRAQILLAGVMIMSAISAGFWMRELRKLKIARLIAENPILHIHTAIISDISAKAPQRPDTESIEVIVSYFGILLDEKIIKFNQDDIRLKAVEIGRDYLSLDYGNDTDTRSIRLLHASSDLAVLEDIVKKFRYETGITPTITH